MSTVNAIAVLGAGNMGPGMAALFAAAGHRVNLWCFLASETERAARECARALNDLAADGAGRFLERITIGTDLDRAAAQADFVFEAVIENLEIKRGIFARVESTCPAAAIIASNTSSLLPTLLQKGMRDPGRLVAAHFWNPAHLVPLVEVCAGEASSPRAADAVMDLLEKAGKRPVRLKREIPGFIGNRLMHAMNREALSLIEEGVVDAEDVDRVVLASFGPRFAHIGPMEYLDLVGLDLIESIQGYLYGDLDRTPGVMPVIARLNRAGSLGCKSGRGLLEWARKDADEVRRRRDQSWLRRPLQ